LIRHFTEDNAHDERNELPVSTDSCNIFRDCPPTLRRRRLISQKQEPP
jgi:hypothetical protein